MVDGGTLDSGTPYTVEMEFSAVAFDPVDGFAAVTTQPGGNTNFTTITTFEFVTAVPEPSTISLAFVAGIACCGVGVRRKRRR